MGHGGGGEYALALTGARTGRHLMISFERRVHEAHVVQLVRLIENERVQALKHAADGRVVEVVERAWRRVSRAPRSFVCTHNVDALTDSTAADWRQMLEMLLGLLRDLQCELAGGEMRRI